MVRAASAASGRKASPHMLRTPAPRTWSRYRVARIVALCARSAPFSTMCVAQEWRSNVVKPCVRTRLRRRAPSATRVAGSVTRAARDKQQRRTLPAKATASRLASFARRGDSLRHLRKNGSTLREILRQSLLRRAPQGHDALLISFARTSMYPTSSFKSSSLAFVISDTRSAPA